MCKISGAHYGTYRNFAEYIARVILLCFVHDDFSEEIICISECIVEQTVDKPPLALESPCTAI